MKPKLIILGSGGHARSVIDVAAAQDKYEIVGCLSSDGVGKDVACGVKVIGDDSALEGYFANGVRHIFVAVGDNGVRDRLFSIAGAIGFKGANIISPNAVISPSCGMGEGICVLHGAILHVNVKVGDNTIINTKASVDHDCVIGRSCHIAPGVTLSGTVKVGNGVHIGTGSSVIDGVRIGSWSYAGAGSVIVNDMDSGILVYGVPAKNIKRINSGSL